MFSYSVVEMIQTGVLSPCSTEIIGSHRRIVYFIGTPETLLRDYWVVICSFLQGDESVNKIIRSGPGRSVLNNDPHLQIPAELPDLDNALCEIIQLLEIVPDWPGREPNADVHLLGFAFRSYRDPVTCMDQQVGCVPLEARLAIWKILARPGPYCTSRKKGEPCHEHQHAIRTLGKYGPVRRGRQLPGSNPMRAEHRSNASWFRLVSLNRPANVS